MDIEKSIRENQLGAKLHIGKVLGGVDTIEKSVVENTIQKGKPAVAGEIREWSGKKYKKQPNGKWLEVSDEYKTKGEHLSEQKKHTESYQKYPNNTSLNAVKFHEHRASKLDDKEHDEEEFGGVKSGIALGELSQKAQTLLALMKKATILPIKDTNYDSQTDHVKELIDLGYLEIDKKHKDLKYTGK